MSKKKNDDSEVINKKIDELELKLREAKDSELFNIHLKGESDKLFLLARNKLILWVSPIVLAILLLGYNIYDSNKKITEIKTNAENRLKEFNFLFENQDRLKTLKMLVTNFNIVRSIRILQFFEIGTDKNSTEFIDNAKIVHCFSYFSMDTIFGGPGMLDGYVDYDTNFNGCIGFRDFYPSTSVTIKELEKYNYFNIQLSFEIKKSIEFKKVYAFEIWPELINLLINGVLIPNESKEKVSFKYETHISEHNDKKRINLNISAKISHLFTNLKDRFERCQLDKNEKSDN